MKRLRTNHPRIPLITHFNFLSLSLSDACVSFSLFTNLLFYICTLFALYFLMLGFLSCRETCHLRLYSKFSYLELHFDSVGMVISFLLLFPLFMIFCQLSFIGSNLLFLVSSSIFVDHLFLHFSFFFLLFLFFCVAFNFLQLHLPLLLTLIALFSLLLFFDFFLLFPFLLFNVLTLFKGIVQRILRGVNTKLK